MSMVHEMSFGGSKTKAIVGNFLHYSALGLKFFALTIFSTLKNFSRWLTDKSVKLLLSSEKHSLVLIDIKFIDRNVKRYSFLCDSTKHHCYEMGDFKEMYIKYKKERVPTTEEDLYYVRFSDGWIKT